jgi:hypothetical protein
MEEYVYQESDYIKAKDLAEFHRIMILYGFMPEDIEDMDEYNDVLLFLFSIAEKAPNFLQAYEYAITMIHQLKETPETIATLKELEHDFMLACERIAIKDDIYTKTVEWSWVENRPLIRGLFRKADKLWIAGNLAEAHELFTKLYKTNEDDNIGVRYCLKAIGQGMSRDDFNKRFVSADGGYYISDELEKWFER